MASNFHGHCPVCSEQLLVDDDCPETARCPTGHYSCRAKDFNQLWNEFDLQVGRLGQDKANAAYGEKLLKDIQSLNTVKRAKAR